MKTIQEAIRGYKENNQVEKAKSFRNYLISQIAKEVNELRKGTVYKPVTEKLLAIKINRNPFLKSDGELDLLYKECSKRKNFSKLFMSLKSSKIEN